MARHLEQERLVDGKLLTSPGTTIRRWGLGMTNLIQETLTVRDGESITLPCWGENESGTWR